MAALGIRRKTPDVDLCHQEWLLKKSECYIFVILCFSQFRSALKISFYTVRVILNSASFSCISQQVAITLI